MNSVKNFHYNMPNNEICYDYFGENVRYDLEDLIGNSDVAIKIMVEIFLEKPYLIKSVAQYGYDIPKNTGYDYFGESVRYDLEDRLIEFMDTDFDIYITVNVVYLNN
jgi:hypothetical protein